MLEKQLLKWKFVVEVEPEPNSLCSIRTKPELEKLNAPEPSVCKTWPALPSDWGSLKVTLLLGLLSGEESVTLLPPLCKKFKLLIP